MPALFSTTSSGRGTVQTSFELPARCYACKAYPIKAPNGSSIIIYGHAYGLRILWRGGQYATLTSRANGESRPKSSVSAQETREPFLQDIDLVLGQEVLSLAVPKAPLDASSFSSDFYPQILSHKIVVAVGCADNVVRIVSLPLAPPTAETKQKIEKGRASALAVDGPDKWGEQIISIPSNEPTYVALTFTPKSPIESEPEVVDLAPTPARPGHNQPESTRVWNLVVASHSPEATSIVSLTRIPLTRKKASKVDHRFAADQIDTYHTEYLSSPAVALTFNPSSASSPLHLELLIPDERGVVTILDCRRKTRVLSLSVGYQPGSSLRKRILDAQWCHSGTAVVVLQADGEWGLWNLSAKVRGGFVTEWSSSGWLGKDTRTKPARDSGRFALMTPSSRRRQEESLFGGHSSLPTHGAMAVAASAIGDQILIGYESVVFLLNLQGEKGEMQTLDTNMRGELLTAVDIMPNLSTTPVAGAFQASELIVSGGHWLTVITEASPESSHEAERRPLDALTLDVAGIDRLLDEMEDRDQVPPTSKRKVGFLSPGNRNSIE